MTVTIRQRKIDKDTMEQHIYIKYDVVCLSTNHDAFGNTYMRFTNQKGQHSTINLEFFTVEIHQF